MIVLRLILVTHRPGPPKRDPEKSKRRCFPATTANISNETLASTPDYETLDEQKVTVGASDADDAAGANQPQ